MTEAVDDYLKAIYSLSQSGEHVTLSRVAQKLGVSAAAATKMMKRLEAEGMATFSREDGARLSEVGRKHALEVLRGHRLIETFLFMKLNYTWDEVHQEAEQLEHVVSGKFRERLANYLGNPSSDPHGEPIPDAKGEMQEIREINLLDVQEGFSGRIIRVSSENDEILRYLGDRGVLPGENIDLLEIDPFGGSLIININDLEVSLSREVAGKIYFADEI